MTKLALGHTHTHTHTHTHLGFLLLENHHSYFGYHGARCNRERLDWTDIYPKLLLCCNSVIGLYINRLTPNDTYMGRTAPLTSKRCVLYIYSTNVGTEYLKHALYGPFFLIQNAVCFITLTCLVSVLFTFYIQGVLKLKK